MNYFKRRKFKRHPDEFVRLAMIHYDRPTDLKDSILALNLSPEEIISNVAKAIEEYQKYPPIQADLRLSCLRSVCSSEPEMYSQIEKIFPEMEFDIRATRSLHFYKQKLIDTVLGLETVETEPEIYEDLMRINLMSGDIDWANFSDSDLAERSINLNLHSELIELSISYDRTLNQLKEQVMVRLNETNGEFTIEVLIDIISTFIQQQKHIRGVSDLFVASLRAIAEQDINRAIKFGNMFVSFIPDHRALRSLALYNHRIAEHESALRLLRHPNFRHDQKTRPWLEKMIKIRSHEILDGKFRPKFESFGDDFKLLSEYIDDIYLTLNADVDVARYIYGFIRNIYQDKENQHLAAELIRWGDVLQSNSTKSNSIINLDGNAESISPENQKSYDRLLRELRRLEDSVSLQLGNHITHAVRNPLKMLILPITLLILTIKLGLQRLGKTKVESGIIPLEEHLPRKHSIVLFPTNGVGFGHFTRMYAVARALRKVDPSLEIVFFTPMPTLHILYSDNFPTYHIAGRYKHSNMTARQWNGLIEEMLTLIFEMHSPKWFMFDGAFPYRGMLNAIQAQSGMEKLWMQRGTLKKNKKIPVGTVEIFDTIVRPQDINSAKPPNINMLTQEIFVPPITLIEPHEMLERNQARAALSAPQDCKLIYVQLGAGRINEIKSTIRVVIDELLSNQDVHVVLGESLLGERTMLGLERLHVIRDYPNALFFKAFDASVQAGGYNSFHEMRSIRMPTLFIPNTKTGMDDQLKRVMLSVEEGWGLVVEETPTEITKGLGELLRKEPSGFEPMPNGATETANRILSIQYNSDIQE